MKRSQGFTLIELLISFAIIGILAAIVVGALNPQAQLQKARDAKRKTDLEQIRAALEEYRADQGGYPTVVQFNNNTCGAPFTDGGSTTYLQSIPCDPLAPNWYNTTLQGSYFYKPTAGTSYTITACLENINDTDPHDSSTNPGGGTGCLSNPKVFYTITNP